jgi:hypothetical protein
MDHIHVSQPPHTQGHQFTQTYQLKAPGDDVHTSKNVGAVEY